MITRIVLWTMAAVVPFGVWYVLWGRNWLKSKPSMAWLYKSRIGEWTEVNLFSKSESILWARILQAVGYVLTCITFLGEVDLTPLIAILPESLRWLPPLLPLIISAAGHIQVKLRKDTTLPLAVVALPDAEKERPQVAAAIEGLQVAKAEAVTAATEASASADGGAD